MIGRLLFARARRRIHTIGQIGMDPERLQEATLLRLVRSAARTRFGKEHGFLRIKSAADFRERVPLQDYASMQPYFQFCYAEA